MKKIVQQLCLITTTIFLLITFATPANAAISTTGDVQPADPATWGSSTSGYIGKTSSGTMDVTGGSDVLDRYGYIGYESGSAGEVTVDGAGSTWTNSDVLYIGYYGSGTLNITSGGAVSNSLCFIGRSHSDVVTVDGDGSTWANSSSLYVGSYYPSTLNITDGGAVSVEMNTWVFHYFSSSSTIHFNNGTLTTGGLLCSLADLTGTGTIDTHGLISDVELIFDATHGLNQTFTINDNPGQNITLNLNGAF